MASLRIGTCSFTAEGWETSFYPPGLAKSAYLSYYAEHFDTLEVDSTYYRIPAHSTVRKWHDAVPADFRFACKMTQVVTHEKCMEDCESDVRAFVEAMDRLEGKLGAILLQFPYFNKKAFKSGDEFLARLKPFLKSLPQGKPWVLEVRNKAWLGPQLLELLRENGVAFAMIDHPWMARPGEMLEKHDPVTAGFGYVRLLGDRYKIEEKTKVWDKVVHDASCSVHDWVDACRRINHRGVELLVYVNNHFEGHAPATVRKFIEAWGQPLGPVKRGESAVAGRRSSAKAGKAKAGTLF